MKASESSCQMSLSLSLSLGRGTLHKFWTFDDHKCKGFFEGNKTDISMFLMFLQYQGFGAQIMEQCITKWFIPLHLVLRLTQSGLDAPFCAVHLIMQCHQSSRIPRL